MTITDFLRPIKSALRMMPAMLVSVLVGLIVTGCDQPINVTSYSKPTPVPVIQITGKLEYQDRVYDSNGFINGNMPYKPIRDTLVDLIDDRNVIIATTKTNQVGLFSFNDIPIGSYTLQIVARSNLAGGQTVSVYNNFGALYAMTKAFEFTQLETVANWRINVADNVAGIFNILDVMNSAFEYVDVISQNTILLDDLSVFWQVNNNKGSYTCFMATSGSCDQGPGIYVLSSLSSDTDEFDDDVLLHEFAHWMEKSTDMLDSPGGPHSAYDTGLDLRLSWSEGHSSYFQAAVKDWLRNFNGNAGRLSIPGNMSTDQYTDTTPVGIALHIDYLSLSTHQKYASNEAAVTHVLLAMKDSINSSHEIVFRPFTSALQLNATADTLESFWDALLVGRSEVSPSNTVLQWKSALNNRQITYDLDSYEPNDDMLTNATPLALLCSPDSLPASCIPGLQATLYLTADVTNIDKDYYKLSLIGGVTYTISTDFLTNGADTQIALFDSVGNPVLNGFDTPLYNDDAIYYNPPCCPPPTDLHNGSHFSSEIMFTPGTDTTVYLLVESAEGIYDPTTLGLHGSGRYGGYQLFINAS